MFSVFQIVIDTNFKNDFDLQHNPASCLTLGYGTVAG